METSAGWNMVRADDAEWAPWGSQGNARAKVLGTADGYYVTLVEADAGYRGDPHEHTHAEFFYVLDGTVRNQGEVITAGGGLRGGRRIEAHRLRRRVLRHVPHHLPALSPRSRGQRAHPTKRDKR